MIDRLPHGVAPRGAVPHPIDRIAFGKGWSLLAVTALASTLGGGAANAACVTSFCWNATSGIWSTSSNWTPSGPPSSASSVAIGNGGIATVDSTNAFSAAATIDGNSGVVISPGGTWTSTGTIDLGDVTGSGTLTVNGGTLSASGQRIILGFFGSSTSAMLIENGGAVTTTAGAQIGPTGAPNTASGTVTVTGPGSTWNIGSGVLYLENPGISTGITVADGAGLISGEAVIGGFGFAGSSNNVLITGAGSTWQSSGTIVLGNVTDAGAGAATGMLTVTNGAQVSTSANVAIGYNLDGGNGLKDAVTVDGGGSKLTAAATIYAGYYGTGALTVSNGAVVSDTTGIIGYSSTNAAAALAKFFVATPTNSTGSVLVTGPGSLWANTNLIVGDNATVAGLTGSGTGTSTGMLTVANYGAVSSTNAIVVGANAGATGTINIGAAAGQAAAAPGTISTPAIQFGTGGGTIVFNHTSSDYLFAAPIEGAGSVDVEHGNTALLAVNTYTGATTVNGGILDVAGAITGSSGVTVNAGGILTGLGSITSAVTINSGGTFVPVPGNAFARAMTINGSLAFQSGALYVINVNAAGAAMVNVSGTASLAGTVAVGLLPGASLAKSYDILHSAGLGGTTFGGVSQAGLSNFDASLSYSTTDVFLNLTADLGRSTTLNANQQSVASAINAFFNGGGTLPPGFATLFGLTGGNLGNALTQASGETATGSQQATFEAMNLFMGVLTDPFLGGRGDSAVSGAGAPTGYASTQNAGTARDAYAMFTKAPLASTYDPHWSVWVAGYGGSQTTDGNAALGSNTATSSVAGTVVGADYRFSPSTIAGFALAGGGTSFSVANGGTGRSDLFQAGAFIRHTVGPAYLTAALAYGWQDITTNRTVTIAGVDQLRAEFNANAVSGRIEGGYRFVAPWTGGVGITPYAAGQFTTFDLPAYAESAVSGAGTFGLAYGAKDVTDVRSELGVRADKSYALADSVLTLRGRLAWAHDFDPDRSIAATFQALPGASFVVNGAAQASEAVLTTASAELKWMNGWSAAATFEGEFSDVTSSYAGKGVVRYQW